MASNVAGPCFAGAGLELAPGGRIVAVELCVLVLGAGLAIGGRPCGVPTRLSGPPTPGGRRPGGPPPIPPLMAGD